MPSGLILDTRREKGRFRLKKEPFDHKEMQESWLHAQRLYLLWGALDKAQGGG